MAKTYPDVPAKLADINEAASYEVRVKEPVPIGRRRLAVSLPHRVTGAFLKTIWESVRDAKVAD